MNPADRFVFAPSIEGLVRGLGHSLTPNARAELRTLGIDVDRPLLPGYPAAVWHQALALVAKHVYPALTPEEAHFKMGERTVYGLDQTMLGKAMIALARVIGPRRTLQRLPSSARTGSNFAALTVTELSPTEFTLESYPFMGYGEFMQGSVHAAITMTGGKDAQVEITGYADERLELRARWG